MRYTFRLTCLSVLLCLLASYLIAQDSVTPDIGYDHRLREDPENEIRDIVITDDIAYGAMKSGLAVYDLMDVSIPVCISKLELEGGARSVAISDTILFVGLENGGVLFHDIAAPRHPSIIGHYDSSCYARDIVISGDLMYLACGEGLEIVDISDLSSPTPLGLFSFPHSEGYYPRKLQVRDSLVLVAAGDLWIIDASDVRQPKQITRYVTSREQGPVDLVVDDTLVYIADQSRRQHPGNSALTIVNIADPSNPVRIGHFSFHGNVYRVAKSGNYVYLGAGLSGMVIVDVSDPANPHPVGCYPTPPHSFAMDIIPRGDSTIMTQYCYDPPYDDYAYDICADRLRHDSIEVLWPKGYGPLSIIDVADKAAPSIISDYYDPRREKCFPYDGYGSELLESAIPKPKYKYSCPPDSAVSEYPNPSDSAVSEYPNPFSPVTYFLITLDLACRGHAKLTIYDIKGTAVATPLNRNLRAGRYRVVFDGIDSSGRAMASGIYFYKLITDDKEETKKFVLLR